MTATPMRLEDALRFNGYTIDQTDNPGTTIHTSEGDIVVPPMRLSTLTWRRDGTPEASQSFYLATLPMFDDAYRPVILSHILDRYSTRRLAYDMPDMFGLAVRRWANLNLGPMSVWARLYRSTAVNLPLTTQDAAIDQTSTDKARDAFSEFPQGQLSGDLDYASSANDRVGNTTGSTVFSGRMGQSVMQLLAEQRASYLNVDERLLDAMDSLFLTVWDRSERDDRIDRGAPSAIGFLPSHW